MTDELVAYLMDDLPPERRAEVEERLATDFAWQRELKRLEECLAASGDPAKCPEEPPQDLVRKTCSLVESSDLRPGPAPPVQRRTRAAAAFTADSPCLGSRLRSWSVLDLAVGGGVLLLVGALVTPALFEAREATRRSVCQSNLQQLGAALFEYQEVRDHYLPAIEPGETAGAFAVALLEGGLLTREQLRQLLVCPESPLADEIAAGRVVLAPPTRAELAAARGAERDRLLRHAGGSFAYTMGYRDDRGAYRQRRYTGEQGVAVLSDAPRFTAAGVRSVNHVRGHNIVYEDLSVRLRTDGVQAAKFFLNEEGKPAAGLGPHDLVLGRSDYGPNGRVVRISLAR